MTHGCATKKCNTVKHRPQGHLSLSAVMLQDKLWLNQSSSLLYRRVLVRSGPTQIVQRLPAEYRASVFLQD